MTSVSIHYHRPGKPLTIYEEDLISDDGVYLRTTKTLPPEISERLSRAMLKDNLISSEQRVLIVNKIYFFSEHFNLLEFRDTNGDLLGHYSDIGTPLTRIADGYAMTDWFLDIWLYPNGELRELDWDEFQEACAVGLLNLEEQRLAVKTMQRLKDEAAQNIYPSQYLE